ncbi:MAG: urease accessory protein [Saprospiraceae bacterium]|nr:urease accessory protein [Saprospiraceae bacterium]
MDTLFPLLIAGTVGFSHAFEVDHLVAVSSLVTRRHTLQASLKDGIFWGLGHTSTILLIGMLMIFMKVSISEQAFEYLEACVGAMLIGLGIHRVWKMRQQEEVHRKEHLHALTPHHHRAAYGVGLVHGLAGSGALVLLVMAQLNGNWESILYLIIFGIGSIFGMMLASGLFSLPFSKKMGNGFKWGFWLTWLSSGLCIFWGLRIIYQNLLGA